jgi:hypothetical protein
MLQVFLVITVRTGDIDIVDSPRGATPDDKGGGIVTPFEKVRFAIPN